MKRRDFTKALGLGGLVGFLPVSLQKVFASTKQPEINLSTSTEVVEDKPSNSLNKLVLDSAELNKLVSKYFFDPELQKTFPFLSKAVFTKALDDEIAGKFRGQVFAADIIADDQKGTVYESGAYSFAATGVPNIKLGQQLGDGVLRRINRIKRNKFDSDKDKILAYKFFKDWQETSAKNLAIGLLQRVDALMCAMFMDSLQYSRLGIMLSNCTWGMPTDLKIEADFTKDNPIKVIKGLFVNAQETYGETYDYMIMSSVAFTALYNSIFKTNFVSNELWRSFDENIKIAQKKASEKVMKEFKPINLKDIEINDRTYWERSTSGRKERVRVLPKDMIIFMDSKHFNNSEVCDFAHTIPTESICMSLVDENDMYGDEFGPIGYYTGTVDFNPPSFHSWAVLKGFPRKHIETCSAVMKVVLPVTLEADGVPNTNTGGVTIDHAG